MRLTHCIFEYHILLNKICSSYLKDKNEDKFTFHIILWHVDLLLGNDCETNN
jgi:hypothetical protein